MAKDRNDVNYGSDEAREGEDADRKDKRSTKASRFTKKRGKARKK